METQQENAFEIPCSNVLLDYIVKLLLFKCSKSFLECSFDPIYNDKISGSSLIPTENKKISSICAAIPKMLKIQLLNMQLYDNWMSDPTEPPELIVCRRKKSQFYFTCNSFYKRLLFYTNIFVGKCI